MHIAITTPTGHIGRALTHILQAETDHQLTLLARDASKLTAEVQNGATVKQGDLLDADFLVEATKGADSLFFLVPPNFVAEDFRAYQNEVNAAGVRAVTENNIGHVLYLSSVGAQHSDGTGPIAGLHDGEVAFQGTGTNVTVLRPTFFMENYYFNLDTIRSDGNIYMPCAGTTSLGMIATADIARAASDVFAGPPEGFRVVELLGPRDYTFDEAAGIIGAAVGRPVNHVLVTPDQAREGFLGVGVGADLTRLYLEMYASFDSGHIAPEFPRSEVSTTPTKLEAFASAALVPALTQPA